MLPIDGLDYHLGSSFPVYDDASGANALIVSPSDVDGSVDFTLANGNSAGTGIADGDRQAFVQAAWELLAWDTQSEAGERTGSQILPSGAVLTYEPATGNFRWPTAAGAIWTPVKLHGIITGLVINEHAAQPVTS